MFVTIAAAVEAVGAHPFLRQSDTLDKVFESGKFYTGESQSTSYLIHHALILWGSRLGVCLQVLVLVALDILDDSACDEFQVSLR